MYGLAGKISVIRYAFMSRRSFGTLTKAIHYNVVLFIDRTDRAAVVFDAAGFLVKGLSMQAASEGISGVAGMFQGSSICKYASIISYFCY